MIKIAEVFGQYDTYLQRMVKQCGVDYVVGSFSRQGLRNDEKPWDFMPMVRSKTAYNDAGFIYDVLENRPPMAKTKLGLPGRDEEIEEIQKLIRNMGRLGIGTWCYEFMAGNTVLRTTSTAQARGGALATGYDNALLENAPPTEWGTVSEEQMWDNLKYFLDAVVPVAEEYNVKLAAHPDDPPLSPIRGIARVLSSLEGYQKLIDLVPSPVNGIALCQGNFTLMTDDLPAAIRHFGKQNKIFFVHFRDVRGDKTKFTETFHDNGKTDMLECLRAYRDVGFEGVCRPDHVPTMEGDSNDRPSYSKIGRLFAIGYIKGLCEAVYAE